MRYIRLSNFKPGRQFKDGDGKRYLFIGMIDEYNGSTRRYRLQHESGIVYDLSNGNIICFPIFKYGQ